MMSKSMLVLLALSGAAAARPTWSQLGDYTFEKFVQDFDLSVTPGSAEWKSKEQVFIAELNRVREHNKAGKSWKEGINKFSAMTATELKAYKGRSKGADFNHKPKHEKALPTNFVMKPVSSLPTDVDWRTKDVVSPVKDQGSCGSCWAFAATATVESHVALESGLLYDLSVERTAFCSPNPEHCGGSGGCAGATAEIAFDYLAGSSGLFQEYQQGYTGYGGKNGACVDAAGSVKAHIGGYVKLAENNYTALMNAVATVGPIAISVDANWGGYESGVFQGCDPKKNVDIDHAVVLVGYGVDNGQQYWLVRNSWSPSWGEKGYIRIARSDSDETNCATDSTPQDGTACAGDTTPVKVCGTCGILYDSSYPAHASAV